MTTAIDWTELDRTGNPRRPPSETAEERALRLEQNERSRLAQRERVKARKETAAVNTQRLTTVESLIAACESRKESFAAAHVEACRPLQEQLRQLETEGREGSPEYSEVRGAVDDLNDRLKRSIEREDKRIAELQNERRILAGDCNQSLLNSELFQLGNPALLETMHATISVANALENFAARYTEQGARTHAAIARRFATIARREAQAAEQAVLDE
jgi:hypothetical protein